MDRPPKDRPPCVVVHGMDDARAALAARAPITLLSGRGAALYAGCGWWRALIAAAQSEYGGREIPDILDCADAPGLALEALRIGQRVLILSPACAAFPLVAARARLTGGVVLPARPPALDLAIPGMARRLDAWLAGLPAGLPNVTDGGT